MKKLMFVATSLLASLPALASVEPPVTVPEPGALALMGLGLAGVVASRLLRKK
jgi:hypothetical protein